MKLKRLFLLFCVGIIIPSAFLIYLGFSSLRAEHRLREKEVAERLGSSVEAWMAQIDAELQAAMDAHTGWNFSAVMDAQGRWIDPFHESVEFSWPVFPSRRAARLETIKHTEFVEKDYLRAAAEYDTLGWDLESPPWTAELLLRAAHCRRKAQAWAQAIESLDHIARRYSDVRNEQGIPFGLLAATELTDIYAASGHKERAIDKTLETLMHLERQTWILSWKDEKSFAQRLHERLREWAPQMTEIQTTRWQTRAQTLNARAARIDMLEEWQAKDWPHIQQMLRAEGRANRPTLVWPKHADDFALWINPIIDADSGRAVRTQVAWCHPAVIEALWHHDARGSSVNLGFTAHIQPAAKGSVDGVKRRLSMIVPPMELHIRATGSSSDAYAATRKKIFRVVVFLASVMLIVALKITWHSLAREMDVSWLKARFVAEKSPTLQTPPSIIALIGEKLQFKGYEHPRNVEEYYTMLREETLRLKEVIEDVLDFSRLMNNRAPYPLMRFDWVPSLRQTMDQFQQSDLGRHAVIDFTSSLPACFIAGHAETLSRVVLNLLDNAVRYSPSDRADIRVVLRREGEHALLDVIDHGDGISLNEQASVFNRFYRGPSAHERSVLGAGLGLSIARYIVQAHHGTITLQSALGKGSTFTVRLPLFSVQ